MQKVHAAGANQFGVITPECFSMLQGLRPIEGDGMQDADRQIIFQVTKGFSPGPR